MQLYLRNAAQDIVGVPISSAVGGEGYICKIRGRSDQSVKIYNTPVPTDLEPRLEHEMNDQPGTIVDRVAWPLDIVEDGRGDVIGYVQQHFPQAYVPFTAIAYDVTRPPWASEKVLRQCAYDAAYLIAELHAHNYLYPDIHGDQFLVAKKRPAVLIDMASCQFTKNGTLYPCTCLRGEYQPPGLLGCQSWAQVADRRDVYTDAWSLAFLLFELTMGCHPFDGIHVGTGSNLSPAERAEQGEFPFDRGCRDYRPPPNAPAYRHVDSDVRDLFFRCFVDGHRHEDRAQRPTPAEWADVLRHCPQLHSQPRQSVSTPWSSQSGSANAPGIRAALAFLVPSFKKSLDILARIATVAAVCGLVYYFVTHRPSRPRERVSPQTWAAPSHPPDPPQPSTKSPADADIDLILHILRYKVPPAKKETRP